MLLLTETQLFQNKNNMKWYTFIFVIPIIFTISACKKFPDLGNGYQLNYNGMNDISITKCLKKNDAPTIIIRGHILDYAFDSTFIIVSERPRDSVPGIETLSNKKFQENFEKSTFQQFWIIDKKKELINNEKEGAY